MTEKAGVGSEGTTSITFLPTGSAHLFVWDSGTNLPNTEDDTVYVRLRGNDTLASGSTATTSAFALDHKVPVIANVTASQNAGVRTVAITYDLTEHNTSTVVLEISDDGGSTWTVPTTSATGAVGSGITEGVGKAITWNAGTDFDNQYQTDIRVRLRATDAKGNVGAYTQSANFTVDTNDPTVTSVTGSQDSGAMTFTFLYDLAEDAGTTTVGIEASSDNGSTWTVPTTTAAGALGAGTVSGTSKTVTWNAGTDYNDQEKTTMLVRFTATDGFSNAGTGTSAAFTLDTKAPRITSVSAAQVAGSTNVTFTYTLADQSASTIALDISQDSGATWTVTDTSVTGSVGSGQTAGSGKTITWAAGTDFDEQQQSDLRVRVRGTDVFNNASVNTESADFALDTLNPATLATADLTAQPSAGATTVSITGSFTETNPNTNDFSVAINGGAYGSSTAGTSNTATPGTTSTAVGAPLDGNDYISQVKITHTDDFGQATTNENTSPSTSFKYVKPYTPQAPTVNNPTVGTVDVLVNPHASEISGLEYAIFETTQSKYVQTDGTLGASAAWAQLGTASGQWGNGTGVSGKVRVTGLANASYTYQFQVKSRNTSDTAHAASSESALSSGASSANQSPTITFGAIGQTTDGTRVVNVNYTVSDLESEAVSLNVLQYSTNGTTWVAMSEKSGVGSQGTTGLATSSTGSAHLFAWDVATDLPTTEDATVFVRLRANDGTSDGATTTSNGMTVDTKNPTTSAVTGVQVADSGNVTITYTLADLSTATVVLEVSEDAGVTWAVPTTSATGDVGSGVAAGIGKTITWNAGTDFANQEQSDIRARVRATDAFGNAGTNASSANFAVDTKAPVVANAVAAQNAGAGTVAITYDLTDGNGSTVVLESSEDNGSTWGVTTTSATGAVGAGVTPGVGKTITWNVATDFPNREQSIRVRIRATDGFANVSANTESANFAVDTLAPRITAVSATQPLTGTNVTFTYTLADASTSNIALDISSNSGSTWTVTDTSVSGSVGAGQTAGSAKTITWTAATDSPNTQSSTMRVRIRGTDGFSNASANTESADFALDTLAPAILSAVDLVTQPNAGDTTVAMTGSFTEANPNTNDFSVALNGGAYGSSTSGTANTATPGTTSTAAGATLDGNDYVSKVKATHTDDYGQATTSEDTTPTIALKYVKPYTPQAPTVNNPTGTTVDVLVNPHASETTGLEYAIYETSQAKYAQTNGTLGVSAVWKQLGTAAGQWGVTSGVAGKVTVTGLSTPLAQYQFKVKSRNTSDVAHAASSESALSTAGAIPNTAPSIVFTSVAQTAGSSTVIVSYTGTDAEADTTSLVAFEYSTDNSAWATMTEGAGDSGTTGLAFTPDGAAFTFAWNAGTDLPNTEDATVYVRLRANDAIVDGATATSSAFAVDTKAPVVAGITVSQTPATRTVAIAYDLADGTSAENTIALAISSNDGATYAVPTTTTTGDVGSGVSVGAPRQIAWDAGTDFGGEEQSNMRVRITATDRYGNAATGVVSSAFTVDTKAPHIASVAAAQEVSTTGVGVTYALTDGTPAGHVIEFSASADSGTTWALTAATATGAVGAGQTTGTQTFIWTAGTDASGLEITTARIRVRARDYYGNQGAYASSSVFTLDTKAPVVTLVTLARIAGADTATIGYTLADATASGLSTALDVSSDGGLTWTVPVTTATGHVGANQTTGTKVIAWDVGTDLPDIESEVVRARVRVTDAHGNAATAVESGDAHIDTRAPIGLANVRLFSRTDTTATLAWSPATDATFDHYELWHGANAADVDARSGTATQWSTAADAMLSNVLTVTTTITGIPSTGDYFVKVFAVDAYGFAATVAAVNVAPPAVQVVGGGGGGGGGPGESVFGPDVTPPGKPVLFPLAGILGAQTVTLSGLAEVGARVDFYDGDGIIASRGATAAADGAFSRAFEFTDGEHRITITAVDAAGNVSVRSDAIVFRVDRTPPAAPELFLPTQGQQVLGILERIVGTAEPNTDVVLAFDGQPFMTIRADAFGTWQHAISNAGAIALGVHEVTAYASDALGRASSATSARFEILAAPTPPATPLSPPFVGGAPIPTPAPSIIAIRETSEAIELPALPPPAIERVQATLAGSVFAFRGTALPRSDVLVFVRSERALLYRATADAAGRWEIAHAQAAAELQPGDHTINAIAYDPVARVKTRSSVMHAFRVEKRFWVQAFQTLRLPTTAAAVAVIAAVMIWLAIQRRRSVPQV